MPPSTADTMTIRRTVLQAIERAPLREDPFCFFYMKPCFPSGFYKQMIDHFPADHLYRQLEHPDALRPDGTSTRSVFELTAKNLEELPSPEKEIWSAVKKALSSADVKKTIFRKFSKDLAPRFGIPRREAERRHAFARCGLHRDVAGFRINPHPDIELKLATILFYLPKDSGQQGLGTTIYRSPDSPLFTACYRSNSGCAFAVSKKSWHARDPIPDHVKSRDMLTLVYYTNRNAGAYDLLPPSKNRT